MYKHSKCPCSQKLQILQLNVQKIMAKLCLLQNQLKSSKFAEKPFFNSKVNDETFLLQKTIQKDLYEMLPIKQQMHRLSLTVKQLKEKCEIIPTLKNNISMQTKIIQYLQRQFENVKKEDQFKSIEANKKGSNYGVNDIDKKTQICKKLNDQPKVQFDGYFKKKCMSCINTNISIQSILDAGTISIFNLTPSQHNYK